MKKEKEENLLTIAEEDGAKRRKAAAEPCVELGRERHVECGPSGLREGEKGLRLEKTTKE